MIKLGIVGYGNLGRAVMDNVNSFPDMQICALFTRRPQDVKCDYPVYSVSDLPKFKGKLDVLIMCGGSATDLGAQTPEAAKLFNVVDSFDTHAKIPRHLAAVDKAAKEGGNVAVISVGWDPGLFSMARAMFNAYLPCGELNTFWGKGVSQGHSDAIRRVKGVKKGVQYTIPKEDAIIAVREGNGKNLTARDKHLRECFIVAESGANTEQIRREIVQMPNYFADYDTVVHFITDEEFTKNHSAMPHGGRVIASGNTANHQNVLELSINLNSNPHFTSSVLLAYARAAFNLSGQKQYGGKTIYDIPLSALYENPADLIKNIL